MLASLVQNLYMIYEIYKDYSFANIQKKMYFVSCRGQVYLAKIWGSELYELRESSTKKVIKWLLIGTYSGVHELIEII